jgi:molecular chaperone GrpE
MLPTLDALDRIIEFGDSMANKGDAFENWLTSIKALRTRLLKTMEGIGLIAISSVGTEVDLEIHDVVAVVPAGNFPANTVVSEQQRGYYFRNKLLRDAKVVVAQ